MNRQTTHQVCRPSSKENLLRHGLLVTTTLRNSLKLCDCRLQTLRNVTTGSRHSEIPSGASPTSVHARVQTLHIQKLSMETSHQSAAFVPVYQTARHYVPRNLVSVITILLQRAACDDKVPPAGMCLTCNGALCICFSIKAQSSCHESQTQYHP